MKFMGFVLSLLSLAASLMAGPAIEYSGYYADLVRLTPDLNDSTRIPIHFNYLLKKFRAKDSSSLSPELLSARAMNFRHLEEYRDKGVFPINEQVAWRQPVFIDNHGTHCAVGYLVMDSGHPEAAKAIAARENLAYVMDIKSPELDPWIAASGLTKEECAMIQPSYACIGPNPTATVVPRPATQCAEVYIYTQPSQPGLLRARAFTQYAIKEARLQLSFNDGRPDQSINFSSMSSFDGIYGALWPNSAGELCAQMEFQSATDPTLGLQAIGAGSVMWFSVGGYCSVPLRRLIDAAKVAGTSQWGLSMLTMFITTCVDPNPQNPFAKNFDVCAEVPNPEHIQHVVVAGKDSFGAALDAGAYFEMEAVDTSGTSLDSSIESAKANMTGIGVASLQFIHLPGWTMEFCPASLKASPPLVGTIPTPTPLPALCGPRVEKIVMVPSPLNSTAGAKVALYLSGCAEKFRFDIFSAGKGRVKSWESVADGTEGWQNTALPGDLDLANGQYFIKVAAIRGDKHDEKTTVFYILK